VIEINLLPGAKRKRKGGGFKLALPDLTALKGMAKDPWLIACLAAWLLVLAVDLPLYLHGKKRWAEAQTRLAAARTEHGRYKRLIAKRGQFELARDTLAIELQDIRTVDRDRYIWPHLMQEVARALPDFTWIDRIAARTGDADAGGAPSFTIEGYTVDLQGFTRFLRNLEASPFVREVAAGPTTTVPLEGRDVTRYQITARFEQPDTSQLTMQPLQSTLVRVVTSGGGGGRR
jgi:Tfp pilus assembly protein PilN